jgi:hypothetical protein
MLDFAFNVITGRAYCKSGDIISCDQISFSDSTVISDGTLPIGSDSKAMLFDSHITIMWIISQKP